MIGSRNNVIYNCSGVVSYAGSGKSNEKEPVIMNYVGNYLKLGPSAPGRDNGRKTVFMINNGAEIKMYVAGNHMAEFPAGNVDNWKMIDTSRHDVSARLDNPIEMPRISTDASETAYHKILSKAGASLPARDAVDTRIIENVRKGSGRVPLTMKDVGGWPKLKHNAALKDSDNDGMPDIWEKKHGLNSKDSSDNVIDNDGDVYTNIEEFINGTDPIVKDGG